MNATLDELRALLEEADRLSDGFTCDASADCCRFGVTGREPYVTAAELALLGEAVAARGGLPKRRKLTIVRERACALLGDDGRCLVYAARPLGCRTFYCHRARGPTGEAAHDRDRKAIAEVSRRVADLSARAFPRDGGARPLSRATAALGRPGLRR